MSYSNTNLNGVLEINKLNSAKICELGKQQVFAEIRYLYCVRSLS